MIYKVTINDKVYEVEVEEGKANLLHTGAAAQPVTPSAPVQEASKPAQVQTQLAAPNHAASNAYVAPMPGTILDIKVSKGQQVKKGDTIIVIEAMKMENEISAELNGTVIEIYVAKGAQVNTGTPLILIT